MIYTLVFSYVVSLWGISYNIYLIRILKLKFSKTSQAFTLSVTISFKSLVKEDVETLKWDLESSVDPINPLYSSSKLAPQKIKCYPLALLGMQLKYCALEKEV